MKTKTNTPKKGESEEPKTWHDTHKSSSTFGQRLADSVANGMGSWRFIIIQTLIVAAWMILTWWHLFITGTFIPISY